MGGAGLKGGSQFSASSSFGLRRPTSTAGISLKLPFHESGVVPLLSVRRKSVQRCNSKREQLSAPCCVDYAVVNTNLALPFPRKIDHCLREVKRGDPRLRFCKPPRSHSVATGDVEHSLARGGPQQFLYGGPHQDIEEVVSFAIRSSQNSAFVSYVF